MRASEALERRVRYLRRLCEWLYMTEGEVAELSGLCRVPEYERWSESVKLRSYASFSKLASVVYKEFVVHIMSRNRVSMRELALKVDMSSYGLELRLERGGKYMLGTRGFNELLRALHEIVKRRRGLVR